MITLPADLSKLMIPVVAKNGEVTQKPFPQVSVAELQAAIRNAAPPPPLSPSAAAMLKKLQSVVAAVVGPHARSYVDAVADASDADFTIGLIPGNLLPTALSDLFQAVSSSAKR